jgi:osmoprotectant transport system ATP-binding protein
MINRPIEPTSGRLEINGVDVTDQPVTELRRSIGYVIQQVGLFPHRTVGQNIATVPRILGWDRSTTADRVAELSELVGLESGMLDRYPDELSGGQQQRVGAVDPIVRTRLQDELLTLQERVQKTIVFVTHDIEEAIRLADRIALLNVGGVLEQYASPDELLRKPANPFVEEFLGEDRGMKRLGLKTVADLALTEGPVVDIRASAAEAAAVADSENAAWVGVVDGTSFAGWIDRNDLSGTASVAAAPRFAPAAQVTPTDTLRSAMELIMTSDTSMAVIDDHGSFGGVVTLEMIRAALRDRDEP